MNIDFLRKRRQAVIDRHLTLESVPGSGYHRGDPSAQAERAKGLAVLSARPVAIQYDSTVWLLDGCAGAAKTALAKFVEAAGAERAAAVKFAEDTGTEIESVPPQKAHAIVVAKAVLAASGDVLELSTKDWNGALYGLNEQGVACVLTGLKDSA